VTRLATPAAIWHDSPLMDVKARSVRLALCAAVTLLIPVSAATAQPPPPPPAPTPAPAPAAATMAVAVEAAHKDGKQVIALRGDRVRVVGTLTPFVAGQTATVRLRLGRRTLVKRTVKVASDGGAVGTFSTLIRARRTGRVVAEARHAATPAQAAVAARSNSVLVLRTSAGYGARGPLVRLLQRNLRAMRYEARVTSVYDAATARAVLAWRKVNGRARLESADAGVVRAVLAGRGGWKVRHPKAGRHVEADISRQALALIDGSTVVAVYPTSSGAAATPTVIGSFRFYLKTPGTNALGMVDANYFIRGYAIHGYASVPTYNASHGCLRVPIPDARRIFDWVRIGDRIFVER